MKKYLYLFFGVCFSLCGCEKEHELLQNETEIFTEYDEVYAISEEAVSSEQIVQEQKDRQKYILNTVDYSELFHDLSGCAVIYDFNK